ncbi:MAG: molybdopterin-dependent oxidoreductase [Ghiorsea sp.]
MSEKNSNNELSRRTFLKAMGLTGAGSALALTGCGDTDIVNQVDLEVRKELVFPTVDPLDFVRPGREVHYASVCRQCPANCDIHAKTREGRVIKLEGNPNSATNMGRLCAMGQAGLQANYNPDRITKPMIRKNGELVEVSWAEAEIMLKKVLGRKNAKLAFLTGAVSGHQAVITQAYMDAVGSKNRFVFDTLPPAVNFAANESAFGHAIPKYDFDKAKLIVSFGADFLGTWLSPVQFGAQYGQFRNAPRGTLVQIEPKMTLTGSNADRWIPIRPGTEGHLALALASLIAKDDKFKGKAPGKLDVDVEEVSKGTGVSVERMYKLRDMLIGQSPSLVLSGNSAEGFEHGSQAANAILLLNTMLGNVGQTILPRAKPAFPDLQPQLGGWAELKSFIDGLADGSFDTAVVSGSNPLYQAPDFMKASEAFAKAKTRVAFSMYFDETTMACDLVLPIHSYLEEWNTSMPAYAAEDGHLSIQQPVMNPVFGEGSTYAYGDIMLGLVSELDSTFAKWETYEAYILESLQTMKPAIVNAPKSTVVGQTDEEGFMQGILASGFVQLKEGKISSIAAKATAVDLPKSEEGDASFAYHLIPSARMGLYDGRHANSPWLQELPDQLTAVVWDSWIEVHPNTAEKLALITGDKVKVSSSAGSLEVKVVVFPGIQEDSVAIPLGQGHTEYGRYAKGVGVNPFKILTAQFDKVTGELATHATKVSITKVADRGEVVTRAHGELVLDSTAKSQMGREIVKTVSSDDFDHNEGEG